FLWRGKLHSSPGVRAESARRWGNYSLKRARMWFSVTTKRRTQRRREKRKQGKTESPGERLKRDVPNIQKTKNWWSRRFHVWGASTFWWRMLACGTWTICQSKR